MCPNYQYSYCLQVVSRERQMIQSTIQLRNQNGLHVFHI